MSNLVFMKFQNFLAFEVCRTFINCQLKISSSYLLRVSFCYFFKTRKSVRELGGVFLKERGTI